MNPAAIVSTLVKVQGIESAAARLTEYDKISRKAAAGADTMAKSTTKQGESAKKSSSGVSSAAKAAVGFLGAVGGYNVVKGAVDTTDSFTRSTLALSRNFGLSAKAASEWGAVMSARGVDSKRLQMSFKTLSAAVQSGSQGSKQSIQMFKQLGISQQDLAKNGGDLQWVLNHVSDGLAKLPPGTNKAAIMGKLFGRTWQDLAPILRNGSASMNQQLGVADKYGATIDGSTKSVEEFTAKQREFKVATLGLQLTLGRLLIPALTLIAGDVLKVVAAFRSASPVVKIAAGALLGLALAVWAVNKAMAMNPTLRVVTLLLLLGTALVTAYHHSASFRQVVDDVGKVLLDVGRVIWSVVVTAFNVLKTAIGAVVTAFNAVVGVLSSVFNWIKSNWPLVAGILLAPFTGGLSLIIGLVWAFRGTLSAAFTAVWGAIVTALQAVWVVISATVVWVFNAVVNTVRSYFQALWAGAQFIFMAIVTALQAVWVAISATVSWVFNTVVTIIRSYFTALWAGAQFIFMAIVTALQAVWGVISATVVWVVNAIVNIIRSIAGTIFAAGIFIFTSFMRGIQAVWGWISGVVEWIVGAIINIIRGIGGTIYAAGSFIFTSFMKGIQSVWGVISGLLGWILSHIISIVRGAGNALWTAGRDIFLGMWNGAKWALQQVIKGIYWFLNQLAKPINVVLKLFGVGQINIGDAPKFAQGGVHDPGHMGATYAKGGLVSQPGYFAGEQAPRYKEVIITENPAYRRKNMGYLAAAAGMLDIPGFQAGGMYNAKSAAALWRSQGGPANVADLMGAIAMAESGGNSGIVNSIGASGLWQIYGLPFPGNPLDPATNARMAISKYYSQGLRAWEAYTNGSYKKFLGGGGGGISLGGILSAAGGLLTSLLPAPIRWLYDAIVNNHGNPLDWLPKPPSLPGAFKDIPKWILDKAVKWFKEQFAGGAGPGFGGTVTNLGGMMPTWGAIDELARRSGLTMTSGYRPGGGSYHAQNRARDYSNGYMTPQEAQFAAAVAKGYGLHILELIHNPNESIKNGRNVPSSFWGGATWAGHGNHVHVAFGEGGMWLPPFGGVYDNGGIVPGPAGSHRTIIAQAGEPVGQTGPLINIENLNVQDDFDERVLAHRLAFLLEM